MIAFVRVLSEKRGGSCNRLGGVGLYFLVLIATIMSTALVPVARRLARLSGAIDQPDARRIHQVPIPRLGGVAIFSSFVLALGAAFLLAAKLEASAAVNVRGILGFAGAGATVFAVGVVDDLSGLRARVKLVFELLAASFVVVFGHCEVATLSTPWGPFELGYLGAPLTILWIVGVTNAINVLDGMDGLAAGIVVIALGTIVALTGTNHASSLVAAILMGSTIGFLAHNFHPATIFMGDSGSLFLGFSVGVLSTYANVKGSTGSVVALPLLVVALPLADISWAMGRRYVRGLVPVSSRSHVAGLARMFVPDKDHIHHRLLHAGLSQREAIYVLYGLQAIASGVALYLVMSWSQPVGNPGREAPTVTAVTAESRK